MMDTNHDKTEAVALFGNGKTLTLKLPFVDRFGQYAHDDWLQKVRDASEFPEDLRSELAVLNACPATWDRFGGWAAGPKREATGHFRTEKVDGRWWLVDPSGNLFFSWGIDVLRHYTDNSFGPAHPDWYETPPPKNGWMSFTHWNLRLKFDKEDYLADYYDFILRRLDSWGINTIGRWSAWQLAMRSQKPYLVHLFDRAPKVQMLKDVDFYDCSHPAFERNFCAAVEAQKREQAVTRAVDDPMCIGIAVGSELDFKGLFRHLPYDKARDSVERFFATCEKAVRRLAPSKLFFACPFTELDQPPVVRSTPPFSSARSTSAASTAGSSARAIAPWPRRPSGRCRCASSWPELSPIPCSSAATGSSIGTSRSSGARMASASKSDSSTSATVPTSNWWKPRAGSAKASMPPSLSPRTPPTHAT